MTTHERIKRAEECSARFDGCRECPYRGKPCNIISMGDALSHIRQLEANAVRSDIADERTGEEHEDKTPYMDD